MSRTVNSFFDLRCTHPHYKQDALQGLETAILVGADHLEDAMNNLGRFEVAQARGIKTLEGVDVAIQVAIYSDYLKNLPEQLRHLQRVWNVVNDAPSCEELARRELTRVASPVNRLTVKGQMQHKKVGYGADDDEWVEEFHLGHIDDEQAILDNIEKEWGE